MAQRMVQKIDASLMAHMETKSNLSILRLVPAKGGIIVQKEFGPQDEGKVMDPPHVFTDHDALCRFLYQYFVDTEAELKKRAKEA